MTKVISEKNEKHTNWSWQKRIKLCNNQTCLKSNEKYIVGYLKCKRKNIPVCGFRNFCPDAHYRYFDYKPKHVDFKRCWALKNLQLLPAKENRIKNAKLTKPFQPALQI